MSMTAAEIAGVVGEEWRPVVGWERVYEVSNLGRVRNAKTKAHKTVHAHPEGYLQVTLCTGSNSAKRVLLHRMVAMAFLGSPPEGKPQVDHIDGNRMNASSSNLRWSSQKDNMRFYREKTEGASPSAVLNARQVKIIRWCCRKLQLNARFLAEVFGVSRDTIYLIVSGKTWADHALVAALNESEGA